MPNSPTPYRHFQSAWRTFKAHPGLFVAAMLVLFASWATLELAVIALHRLGVVFDVLLHLAFLVFFCGLTSGLILISLEALRSPLTAPAPHLRTLFGSLRCGPRLLLAFCLYALGVAVGLALLVIPGIYFAVRYALFAFVLATSKSSAAQSLREAASLSGARWWPLCWLLVRVFLLNLLGAAVLGIGLLITAPVSLLAVASYYQALQPPAPSVSEL